MTHPLDPLAAAIAGVRKRYVTSRRENGGYAVIDLQAISEPWGVPFASRNEAEAWIDREADRACLEATLPVPDAVVEAYEAATRAYVDREQMLSATQVRREGLTAAIHAYTKEGE